MDQKQYPPMDGPMYHPQPGDQAYPPAGNPGQPPPAYQPPAQPLQPQQPYGVQGAAYSNQGYAAQPAGYPGQQMNQPGYPQYGPGATVVVSQPGAVVMQGQVMPDNTGAIIFSCGVAWCCCCILGIIAFVYAVTAHSSRDVQEARRKLTLSTRLSIAGLITGIALYVIFTILRIVLAVMTG